MRTREKQRIRSVSSRRFRRNRARRLRELVTTALLVVFILATCILFFRLTAMRADADRRNTTVSKYYTVVEVSSGDTLWSIAEARSDGSRRSIRALVDEIACINHLQDDFLTAGQKLCIPYYAVAQNA